MEMKLLGVQLEMQVQVKELFFETINAAGVLASTYGYECLG